jgi:hypothetical protein
MKSLPVHLIATQPGYNDNVCLRGNRRKRSSQGNQHN